MEGSSWFPGLFGRFKGDLQRFSNRFIEGGREGGKRGFMSMVTTWIIPTLILGLRMLKLGIVISEVLYINNLKKWTSTQFEFVYQWVNTISWIFTRIFVYHRTNSIPRIVFWLSKYYWFFPRLLFVYTTSFLLYL